MRKPVVAVAEQNEIVEIGRPAVSPVLDVMRRRPRRWAIASWPLAPGVPRAQRASHRPRGKPPSPPYVDHCRIRPEEHAGDACVARQALNGRCPNRAAALKHPGRRTFDSHEGLEAGGHLEVGSLTARPGEVGAVETMAG